MSNTSTIRSTWAFTRQIPFSNISYDLQPNWNAIQQVYAHDDGSLWVQASRGTWEAKKGQIGAFDVFDKDGRMVRQVTLKGQGDPQKDGMFFVGDRLFIVTDWLDSLMALQGGAASEDASNMAAWSG